MSLQIFSFKGLIISPYLDTERLRSFSESAALLSIKVLNLSSSAWQSGDTNT